MLLPLLAPPASATDEPDQLMPGRSATLRPGTLPKVVAKPSAGQTFKLPSIAGNHPTTTGAALLALDTAAPGNAVTFPLPAAGWKALGSPGGSAGFRYKGLGTGSDPCRVVLVRPAVVRARCKGSGALTCRSPGPSGSC
jgi:hypothetical protein